MSDLPPLPPELHLVEVLRAGIPSRSVASTLGVGRARLVETLHRELGVTARGHTLGGSAIKGEYGEGKTHLLNWLYYIAQQENYVVSLVSLSKETPFNRLDHVYRKVAEAIHLPGEPYRGVERLLERLTRLPDERMAITRFSENLHVKPRTVIRNYLEAVDGYHRYLLLGDLEGSAPLAASPLKMINQENNLGRVALQRLARQDYWDYVALLRFLIQLGGYAGWLVLFDEVEMIGLLGAASRASAYGVVADFLGLGAARTSAELAGMHSVFAVATSFYSDILDRRGDLDQAPLRLPRSDTSHTPEQVTAALARLRDAHALLPVDDREVRIALEAIREAHGRAYGWDAYADWDSVLATTRDARLRTKIRAAIECLDITYLYGRPPSLIVRTLDEAQTAEDEDFFMVGAPPEEVTAEAQAPEGGAPERHDATRGPLAVVDGEAPAPGATQRDVPREPEPDTPARRELSLLLPWTLAIDESVIGDEEIP